MMIASVFLSTLTFSLKHRIGESVAGTAHTDGIEVVYSPEFLDKLTVEQIAGLIAHEVWHVAFAHIIRRKDKEIRYYFAAADYVINIMLTDAGFELPPNGLLDPRFRNLSTEEVYEILKQEDANVPEEPMHHVIEGTDGESEEGESSTLSTEKLEDHIRTLLVKASNQAMVSEQYGDIPGEILREIQKLTNPIVPWQILMMDFLTEKAKDDYSWRKPNRRLLPDYYLPSYYSEALDRISIAIDTSGSISDEILSEIRTEIKFIHETLKPKIMEIIDCDSMIHAIHEVDEFTDINDLRFTGGGGTSFQPVFNHCNKEQPTVLIYFTDLYARPITEQPDYPVLWICYSSHEPAEIGETIYVNYEERKAA